MATSSYRDFELGALIGKGDFGKVFACFDKRHGNKKYAMKVIDFQKYDEDKGDGIKKDAPEAMGFKNDEDERKLLEGEAAILMDLKHDFILHALSSFHQDGALIIVTEFYDQGNLEEFLERQNGKQIEEPRIVEWFRQMCSALQYLHSKNIIHRDVKTKNLFLIGEQMTAKLGGFGLAKVLEKPTEKEVEFCGSPYYMSPEIYALKPYDSKVDIWAMGVCIYEMATLERPFDATLVQQLVFKIVHGQIPLVPKESYSKELLNLVEKMMCRDPEKRPSAAQLLDDVLFKKHTFPKMDSSFTSDPMAQHYVECELCETRPAQHFCNTCFGPLCEICKDGHERTKIFQNHEIIPLVSSRKETSSFCSVHRTKRCEFYCKPCKKPVCPECFTEKHNGHIIIKLTSFLEQKEKLRHDIDRIETYLIPAHENLLTEMKSRRAGVIKSTEEEGDSMQKHTKNIIQIVKSAESDIMAALQTNQSQALSSIQLDQDVLNNRMNHLHKIKKTLQEMHDSNSIDDTLLKQQISNLEEMATLPETTTVTPSKFVPKELDTSKIKEQIGNLTSFGLNKTQRSRIDESSKPDV